MNIEALKNALPDFAKDIKLNLGSVLTEAGSPGLQEKQIQLIALACAYATRNQEIAQAMQVPTLSETEIQAMQGAATIMAMNNVYYRFSHWMQDNSYSTMPPGLRMNIMANPGIDKLDFELASLAVSSINGCEMCMNAHAAQLEKAGISKQGIQSCVKIASVINGCAQARMIAS